MKTLLDIMPFGKYKGMSIRDMIDLDCRYVKWLLENTQFRIDNEAFIFYRNVLEGNGMSI
jgi:hypothetical protein